MHDLEKGQTVSKEEKFGPKPPKNMKTLFFFFLNLVPQHVFLTRLGTIQRKGLLGFSHIMTWARVEKSKIQNVETSVAVLTSKKLNL